MSDPRPTDTPVDTLAQRRASLDNKRAAMVTAWRELKQAEAAYAEALGTVEGRESARRPR